jgi:putative ABC transport system permease protein
VLELTIIAVAVMAAVSIRSRGAGVGAGSIAIDPLLAAVPVLIALATGLVLLRVYPVPLGALAALAARGRGLIPTFPLWGAARHSRMAAIPLLVILVATAMGAFSAAILETLADGQAAAAWRSVGADWRVDGNRQFGVPPGFDPTSIDGIEASTGIVAKEARIRTGVVRRTEVRLDGIDPAGLAEVTDGSPLPSGLPAAFDRADWPATIGLEGDPLPVVVSPEVAARGQVGPGTTFHLMVAGIDATAEVVGIRDALPGSDDDESFVIAPLGALMAAYPEVTWSPTSYVLRGGPETLDAIVAAAAPYGDLVHISSREAIYEILHDAPLVATLEAGIAVAIGIAVAYAALALLAGLTLILADRRRDLHVLRTLGLSRRDLTSTILIEHMPLVLVALVGGTVAGLGIAWLLGPSIGLEAYADGGPAPAIAIDPLATFTVGILPTGLGIIVVSIAAILARRADLGRAMRFQES